MHRGMSAGYSRWILNVFCTFTSNHWFNNGPLPPHPIPSHPIPSTRHHTHKHKYRHTHTHPHPHTPPSHPYTRPLSLLPISPAPTHIPPPAPVRTAAAACPFSLCTAPAC